VTEGLEINPKGKTPQNTVKGVTKNGLG